ncbi:MAG: hypothetical protein Ct9H300mP1_32940 [Planctomycetaceae bacterium]|nr:MAG: hypothetical protein Ct9H300mP1_32940 [Planctomycetaceae bacterium]
MKPELSRGVQRTLGGVIGEEDVLRNAPWARFRRREGDADSQAVQAASRDFQPEDSVVDVGRGVRVGGGSWGWLPVLAQSKAERC